MSERRAAGKSACEAVPRKAHAVWRPPADRPDLCGWTLARAHARARDGVAIAAYLGSSDSFDNALAHMAEAYADTNDSDHEALLNAVRSGRVKADTSV